MKKIILISLTYLLLLMSYIENIITINKNLEIILLFLATIFILLSLIKNKIDKKELLIYIIILIYIAICFFTQINKFSLMESIKNILVPVKIFLIPLFIYHIYINFKNIKISKKELLIINLIFILLYIPIIIIKRTVNTDIVLFLLIVLSILGNKSKEKKLKILIIIIIIAIIGNKIINIKNDNNKNNEYIVTNKYEFIKEELYSKNNYITTLSDSINTLKNSDAINVFFGIDHHLVNTNYGIVNLVLYLGLFGSFVYIISLILLFKNIFNTKKYIILLVYILLSDILFRTKMCMIIPLLLLNNNKQIDNKKCNINLELLPIVILPIILVYICIVKNYKLPDIYINLNDKLEVQNNYKLELQNHRNNKEAKITEDIYQYKLKRKHKFIATVIHSHRIVENFEFDFVSIYNNSNKIQMHINVGTKNMTETINFNQYNIDRDYSGLVGYDKLKLPIGYYKDDNYNMIIGNTVHYHILTAKYDKVNKSIVYHMIKQENDLIENYKNIIIAPNESIDTYIIKSKENFLETAADINKFVNITNNNSSWMTYKGNNIKLQYSIEPYTTEGYGKNVVHVIPKDYQTSDEKLYKALTINSLFSLYNYTPRYGKNGIWYTNYTSAWLKDSYGTNALYIDTRLNETLGYILLDIYKKDGDLKYKKAFLEYADFIVDRWTDDYYIVDNKKLLPDYFSSYNNEPTHSSLNHQLSLVNYLYRAYEEFNDIKYYNTANDMLNNLIGFEDNWIRENNDLWYQVNNKKTFSGTDYVIVTFEDLLFTQRYILKYTGKENTIIKKLIESKIKYLGDINVELSTFEKNMLKEIEELKK